MATYSKQILSGTTNNKPVAVAATSSPGTVIHTADATALDEVWLYAVNSSATASKLTVEFGGTTNAENIEITVAGEAGLILIIPGIPLTGGSVIRAFCDSANAINITGYVNRIA